MKRIISFALAAVLALLCGCADTAKVKPTISVKDEITYTVALNPSVMYADGEIESIRNGAASSMSKDVKLSKNFELYENTPWQWLCVKNDNWSLRAIRGVSAFNGGSAKKNMPYAYKFDDNNISSLMVYDSSKMKIEAINKAEMPKSGIALTFKGDTEEAIRFTADNDCEVILSDRDDGNIALVESVSGCNTNYLGKKDALKSVIVRIYKNNRIYWQEILSEENGAVAFPNFEAISLKTGDSLIISFEATNDVEGIITGNCDIPSTTKIVEKNVAVNKDKTYQTTPPAQTELPFINKMECGFVMLYPENATAEQLEIIDGLHAKMEKILGVMVTKMPDCDYMILEGELPEDNLILIGKTKFNPSLAAEKDINDKRKNNVADFIIRQTEKYLVITAVNDIGLELAADFFLKNYCKDENSTFTVGHEYVSSKFNAMKDITLAGTLISDYRLVVSKYASYMEIAAAESFALQVAKSTGRIMTIGRDTDAVLKNEIIIGNTLRNAPEHSNLVDSGTSDKYKIAVSADKTHVTGDSIAAINAGMMKLINELAANGSVAAGTNISGEYDGGYSLSDGYKMVWSDEFNGNTISSTWINTKRITPSVYGGTCYTTNENSYVKDGTLVQKISRDGNDVKEAELDSQGANAMRYKYGYMEFRVRLAPSAGSWGAMWLLGNTGGYNYGEIDAFENFGKLDTVKSNLHIWGPGSQHENVLGENGSILNMAPGTTSPEPFYKNYHTIGVNWQRGRFDFYVDGVCSQSYTYDPEEMKYSCFDNPFYIILSHWGGHDESAFINTGCILPEGFTETNIYYDWIRIYQRENDGSLLYVKE